MKNNKILFICYQITNLVFQLFLIPFLYHSISLSDIGEIVVLTTVSQILINFISSGASIIGVSRHGDITTSAIFITQLLLGVLISVLFFIAMLLFSVDMDINVVFSLYVLSSGLSLYWNYIYHERYFLLFIGNLCAKSVFFIFIVIVPITKFTYSIAITVEYVSILCFFLIYEKESLLSASLSKNIVINYTTSSCNRIINYSALQLDKLIVSSVFGLDSLAVYNFIYKLIDVPTNLLIQFNYIFMSKMRETKFLPKIFALSSGITLCLVFILSDYLSYYLSDNKINISEYMLEVTFLCVLVTMRPYYEYLSFVKYYNHAKYLFPGVANCVSVLPYFIFLVFPFSFQTFFLVVSLCSVLSIMILYKFEIGHYFCNFVIFMFVYVSVSIFCNLYSSDLVVSISTLFILSFFALLTLYKAVNFDE